MRCTIIATVFALAACAQPEPPPPLPAQPQAPGPWFICDGVDAPALLLFERDGNTARVAEYDKPDGALIERSEFSVGEPEGSAGSITTTLTRNGGEAGAIRETNAGMLENPASAYTPRIAAVRLGDREVACRWLPRTRVMGFTGRRSFVVHEDADGDLIYTAFDFAAAAQSPAIELSENAISTIFSTEVRGGAEDMTPNGVGYRFEGEDGFVYVVALSRDGTGRLAVQQNGQSLQSEDLIAFQQGAGVE